MAYGRLILAILCLVLTAPAAVAAGRARADGWTSGTAPVDSVSPAARTITLDEVVYKVPADCRIRRESGGEVDLASLRGGARPGQLVPTTEVDYVRFEAVESASGWRMIELVVLDGPVD